MEGNTDFYNYRIGLRPTDLGDYVINWRDAEIQNPNRNEFAIEDYPLKYFLNEIGFNSCGPVSPRSLNKSN